MKNLILPLVVLMITACGPQSKLRRAERLIKKAELQGAQWQVDSVQVKVPVIITEIRQDTLFHSLPGDTVVITKDRLQVKYVRLRGDSVFIQVKSKQDTVYQTVTKTITKVLYAPDKGLKWWHFILIGMVAMTVLYFIIRK